MEQKTFSRQTRLKSFKVAFEGIKTLFCNEINFRIHIVVMSIAITLCLAFEVSAYEWIAVLILIGSVLGAEAFNTCIEYICNFISPEYHVMIKKIKDIAAAAVLMASIIAVIVGCIIFIPYIKALF